MGSKLSPPLFSRRERYSLVLFSASFIAFSAIVHMMLGGASSGLFPKFKPQATPPPQIIVLDSPTPKPRLSPTPTPRPTPPPPTPTVTAPPTHVQPPIVRPSKNTTGSVEPQFSPQPMTTPLPGTPAPSAPPIAPPTATPAPGPALPVKDSNFRYKAMPNYPDVQMQEGVEGTVIVLVTIGPDGSLLDATIDQSSGNAELDAAALAAARASLYTAPLRDGKPVTAEYRIVYEFKLG